MKIFAPGKTARLDDVPAGGVFGIFEQGQYVRFLRTASVSTAQDYVTVVSLGPFPHDKTVSVQGPASFFWEADTEVIFEDETEIAPRPETVMNPKVPREMELGAIVMAESGHIGIVCRSAPGERALIDLASGELIKNAKAIVWYEHYVLTASDWLRERRVVFDSSAKILTATKAA